MTPAEVRVLVPAATPEVLDLVRREADAVLASLEPKAQLLVAGGDRRVEIDGLRVRLPSAPWPAGGADLARAIAWTMFWSLLERQPASAVGASVACLGGLDPAQLAELERSLGIAVRPAAARPVPEGLEPGPRLQISGLLSPVLDEPQEDRRGSHSAHGVLRRAAARLVGEAEVLALLARVERHRPRVAAAVRDRFDLSRLTAVVRCLVDEGVPLTHPRVICESLLATNCVCPPELDAFIVFAPPALGVAWSTESLEDLPAHALAQCVREGFKSFHANRYSSQKLDFRFRESWGLRLYAPEWTIAVGLIEPSLERGVRDRTLSEGEIDRLLVEIEAELPSPPLASPRREVPLLVGAASRYALWQLVRDVLPGVPVLAYQDLAPEANIQPLFRITL